jgi:hypothetical protein
VDAIEAGHLLRFDKQMALRGNARHFDQDGICEEQKLVCCGDTKRLLVNLGRMYPGAKLVNGGGVGASTPRGSKGGKQTYGDRVRIPMKPAMHSKLKPATRSDLKPATRRHSGGSRRCCSFFSTWVKRANHRAERAGSSGMVRGRPGSQQEGPAREAACPCATTSAPRSRERVRLQSAPKPA